MAYYFTKKHRENLSKVRKGKKYPKLSLALKGHKVTKKTRKKLSRASKGKNNPFYGKKHTQKTKDKISDANKNNKYWLGKKHTKKSKEKISKANSKENCSFETRQKMSKAKKGKKLSKEHRKKLSIAHKGKVSNHKGKKYMQEQKEKLREIRKGDKNPNWKGGKTLLSSRIRTCFENCLWRSRVFKRDNYTCQKCGQRGVCLEGHHINPFSQILDKYKIHTFEEAISCKELWDIGNGITLCKKCHRPKKS